MSNLHDLKIFPLKDESNFENLCLDIWKRKINDEHMQKNGRRGQRQTGVDIFGRRNGTLDWIGLQCKVKSTERLSEQEVDAEIKKALCFNPSLSELIIVTTAPRDQRLQQYVRIKSTEHIQKGLFGIFVYFWEDIELELTLEANIDICYKYYRDFFIDAQKYGHAIGRLVCISIGVEKPDTRYELMIGKTPKREKDEDFYGINYFKGCYFIINLNEKRFDTFPLPCYPSDLDQIFYDRRDRYIISQWLNTVNIDDLVYGNDINYKSTISPKEFIDFINQYKDSD